MTDHLEDRLLGQDLSLRGFRRADGRRVIDWVSDWSRVDELVEAEVLEREGDAYLVRLDVEPLLPARLQEDATQRSVRALVLDAVRDAYAPWSPPS